MHTPLRAVVVLAFVFAACQGAPPAREPLACTLVVLRTGSARELPKAKQQELFAGHFANMGRLAKARDLLLAGPYGDVRHAPDLRGIFFLDTADRQRAVQLAETDPPTQAGVFRLEYHDFVTGAPLRAVLERELARQAEAEAKGIAMPPGTGCRNYVLLTAENGDRALAALAGHAAVLLSGRLDGAQALFVLDAEQCGQVPALFGGVLDRIGPHTVDAWFATDGIAELGRQHG